MEIVLFSNDIDLINNWQNLLSDCKTNFVGESELPKIKDSLVILNVASCEKSCLETILYLKSNNNKILMLDKAPNLQKARKFFSYGVNGYGNAYMSKIYMLDAIQSVYNNLMWLLPVLTSQLIKDITQHTIDIENYKDILLPLTDKEKEIALLLKDGYTNHEISNTLSISLNTVKGHIKNIYEKLNVHDRLSFALLFR